MPPLRLSTAMSATAAPYDTWWVPSPMPRPVTTSALDNAEPETLGVQPAAAAAALSTPSQRASPMFLRRNASGSSLAATASSSIVCSDANANERSSGERSGAPLSNPTIGTAWLTTRRFATAYIEPVLIRLTGIDIGPRVSSLGGVSNVSSWVVSLTIQPCCQPWYS